MAELYHPIDLFYLWTQSSADNERKLAKIIEKGVDRITEKESTLFKRFKKGPDLKVPVKRWLEQRNYELHLTGQLATATITFSGTLLGAAISSHSLAQHVKPGTILERVDGMQCIVATIDYGAKTCTVAAHGGTSLSNDTGAVQYDIIGDAISDANDDFVPVALDRNWRSCGTQIWKEGLRMPWTKKNTAMEAIADELQHQLNELIKHLQAKIAVACMRVLPVYDSGFGKFGLDEEVSTMCGLMGWIAVTQAEAANTDIWVDMSATAVTPEDLNNLVYNFESQEKANYNQGDWVIGCHPVTHQYLSDFYQDQRWFQMKDTEVGKVVESFRSSIGKIFPIIPDYRLRKDVLLIADCSDVQYGYYSNDHIRVVDVAQGTDRQDRKIVTCQTWGTMVRKPRQSICGMHNLPLTYTTA